MTNELNELFPVQFIEGINENEEPTRDRFAEFRDYGVAIPYIPNISYNLARIEIYGSPAELDRPKEHVVRLHTDYKGLPSNTCLVEGKLIVPSDYGEQWLPIELAKNTLVFAKRNYWLTIPEHPLVFAVGLAEDGEELSLRANPSGLWVSSNRKWRFMLRFFGRVLPITS